MKKKGMGFVPEGKESGKNTKHVDRVTYAKIVAEEYALKKITFDEVKKKLALSTYEVCYSTGGGEHKTQ